MLKLKRGSLSGVAWTRDGNYLLFSGTGDPTPKLWRISIKGGQLHPIGLEADENARISFHPDGRRIAFTAGETKDEVWVMEDFLPESHAAH